MLHLICHSHPATPQPQTTPSSLSSSTNDQCNKWQQQQAKSHCMRSLSDKGQVVSGWVGVCVCVCVCVWGGGGGGGGGGAAGEHPRRRTANAVDGKGGSTLFDKYK